jgi:hypothetical protein
MSDSKASAWIIGTALPACQAVNLQLHERRLGFHHWQPRTDGNGVALKCELAWTVRGGFNTGDVVLIIVDGGNVSAWCNDRRLKLGQIGSVDRVRIEGLLLNFAAQAAARHVRAAHQRSPAVGRIASGQAEGAGTGRGAGKAT